MASLRVFNRHSYRSHVFKRILQRHRFSVIVPLNLFAANALQKVHLFLSLNTFSKSLKAQIFRHTNCRTDNGTGSLVKIRQERHINFQFIKLIILQRI